MTRSCAQPLICESLGIGTLATSDGPSCFWMPGHEMFPHRSSESAVVGARSTKSLVVAGSGTDSLPAISDATTGSAVSMLGGTLAQKNDDQ